jgi:hypothetical protein
MDQRLVRAYFNACHAESAFTVINPCKALNPVKGSVRTGIVASRTFPASYDCYVSLLSWHAGTYQKDDTLKY